MEKLLRMEDKGVGGFTHNIKKFHRHPENANSLNYEQ